MLSLSPITFLAAAAALRPWLLSLPQQRRLSSSTLGKASYFCQMKTFLHLAGQAGSPEHLNEPQRLINLQDENDTVFLAKRFRSPESIL